MLIYHPSRYLSSYRYAEHLVKFYKEAIGPEPNAIFNLQTKNDNISVERVWKLIVNDIKVGIRDDLIELGKPVTTIGKLTEEWAENVVDEMKHLQYTACFQHNGRNIFDLSESLAQLFRYRTDLISFQAVAKRLSISLIKQRLSFALAWLKVLSKFFTRLLQRSIQEFERSTTHRVATGTNPTLP